MSVNLDALQAYLNQLRTGSNEDPVFALLELGPEAAPLLIAEFDKRINASIRPDLVEVISQLRNPVALDFLGRSLEDADPAVWKDALDGLVTIGGAEAVKRLTEARPRLAAGEICNGLTLEWIDEAIEQIEVWPSGDDVT